MLEGIALKAIIVAISLLIGVGSYYYFGRDNVVEIIAEDIIEKETGINIEKEVKEIEDEFN